MSDKKFLEWWNIPTYETIKGLVSDKKFLEWWNIPTYETIREQCQITPMEYARRGWQAALAHAAEVLEGEAETFDFEADQLAHCTTFQCRTASKASKAAALALRAAAEKLEEG